jgi:hypothetical protein
MRKFIEGPIETTQDNLMKRLGYNLHCSKEKYPCYHRRMTPDPFPRFHAYAYEKNLGILIDLHFDQANLGKQSNHDKEWAYSGGRIEDEIRRINSVLRRGNKKRIIGSEKLSVKKKKPGKKSLFDVLLS